MTYFIKVKNSKEEKESERDFKKKDYQNRSKKRRKIQNREC